MAPTKILLCDDRAAPSLGAQLARFSATAEPPPTRRTPPLPDRLSFRAGDASPSAVDASAGTIRGVSLLTADREAGGHGVWIDARTLETFLALQAGRRIKAYATHGSWGKDGTLDEVGYWETPKIDGKQLRADFSALTAWKKHRADEYDTLFELAEKMPAEFGASLSFRFNLAWVMPSGEEIATKRKFRAVGAWDYEEYFDPPMPAGALRDIPSVRATEVYSADFVDQPAANDGLFRAGAVDDPAKSIPSANQTAFAMLKELHAKFSAQPAQLARAVALHLENDKLTLADISAKIDAEAQAAELAQLREGAKAKDGEIVSLRSAVEAKDKEIAALQATIASFRKSGADHVPTGGDADSAPAAGELKRAEFSKKTPAEQKAFLRKGGKVVD